MKSDWNKALGFLGNLALPEPKRRCSIGVLLGIDGNAGRKHTNRNMVFNIV